MRTKHAGKTRLGLWGQSSIRDAGQVMYGRQNLVSECNDPICGHLACGHYVYALIALDDYHMVL